MSVSRREATLTEPCFRGTAAAFGFERTHTCYNARRVPIPARDKVLGNERA